MNATVELENKVLRLEARLMHAAALLRWLLTQDEDFDALHEGGCDTENCKCRYGQVRALLVAPGPIDAASELTPVMEALTFYADPGTYHGISILADRPTGGFDEDIDDDHWDPYYKAKPGKKARDVLRRLGLL